MGWLWGAGGPHYGLDRGMSLSQDFNFTGIAPGNVVSFGADGEVSANFSMTFL